jgi:hypothetical protein
MKLFGSLPAVCILTVWSGATALAQAPDLAQAAEIARAQAGGAEYRILQIPKRATALIPLRFVLQEVERSEPGAAGRKSDLGRFDSAEYSVVSGQEAALAYAPSSKPLFFWGADLAETRETFRIAGTYQIAFRSTEDARLAVSTQVEVKPFRYLNFGEEFSFFVAGCLALGSFMVAIIVWLQRREPESRRGPATSADLVNRP